MTDKRTLSTSERVSSYFDRIASDFDSYYETPKNQFQSLTNTLFRKPNILNRLRIALEAVDHERLQRILDIGCGSGVLALPLAQRGHYVIGIDFAQPMIDIAQSKAAAAGVQIDFRVVDFMQGEFLPVDACVALGVLEYFKDPKNFIEKMLSLVSSGGVVVFDIPALLNYHTPFRLPYLIWRKARAYFYTPRGIEKLVEPFRAQLSSVETSSYGAGHVIVMKKR